MLSKTLESKLPNVNSLLLQDPDDDTLDLNINDHNRNQYKTSAPAISWPSSALLNKVTQQAFTLIPKKIISWHSNNISNNKKHKNMFKALAIVLSTLIFISPLFARPDVSYEVSPNTITLGSPFRAIIHIKSKTAFNIQQQPLAEDFTPLHVISQKNINTPNSFNKTLASPCKALTIKKQKYPH